MFVNLKIKQFCLRFLSSKGQLVPIEIKAKCEALRTPLNVGAQVIIQIETDTEAGILILAYKSSIIQFGRIKPYLLIVGFNRNVSLDVLSDMTSEECKAKTDSLSDSTSVALSENRRVACKA